jgi:hypothetical protein
MSNHVTIVLMDDERWEVSRCVITRKLNKQMAADLEVGEMTIKVHGMGLFSVAELVRDARTHRLAAAGGLNLRLISETAAVDYSWRRCQKTRPLPSLTTNHGCAPRTNASYARTATA